MAYYEEGTFREVTKQEYVTKLRRDGEWAGYIEMVAMSKIQNCWIATYLLNERKASNRWQTVKSDETSKPIGGGIIYLKYTRTKRKGGDSDAHYDPMFPKVGFKPLQLKNSQVISSPNIQANILLWNVRSIKEYTKRLFLIDTLYRKK